MTDKPLHVHSVDVRPLTPRQMVAGRITGPLSIWELYPTQQLASELLALWAGLERLAPDPIEIPWVTESARLLDLWVQADRERILDLVGAAAFDLAHWRRRFGWLVEDDDEPEGERFGLAWDSFAQLDDALLVRWAVGKLTGRPLPPDPGLDRAEADFAGRIDLFLGLAGELAGELAAAGRADMDPELSGTLRIHRRIASAVEALNRPPVAEQLLRALSRLTPTPGT